VSATHFTQITEKLYSRSNRTITQKNLVSKTQLGITKKMRGFNNWIEIWRIYEGEGKMNVRYG
jgi:hypothetical protein